MKKIVLGVVVLVLLVPAAGYLYLRGYLPDYDDTLKAPGLRGRVSITRNRYAVPFIETQHPQDLYFAWGYVNALDRMFQMETIKRIGQGRISEFAGEEALPKDVFLRAVGFAEIAEREAENLPPQDRQVLQRFVDGINYYLDTHRRPLYFTLLGMKKEKWTLADPLLIGIMLNWSLAYNMSHEILYHKIAAKIGPGEAGKLLRLAPRDSPAIISRIGEMNDRLAAGIRLPVALTGGRSASNNWVAATLKTAFSGPLLANDPHVHGSKIPNDFYLIRLDTEGWKAAGGQVAGLPFIAFGYNGAAAWGMTNQGADMADLFIETVDWKKKTFRQDGRELPLTAKEATFAVKGGPPVRRTLYYAGRRPLLNEVFPDLGVDVSIDWAGFDYKGFFSGFLALNRVRNHAEFISAVDRIHMSPQNMVFASAGGDIAYRTIGSLLDRTPGSGNFPQPAADRGANWTGLLDPSLNPATRNPAVGLIASANNRVIRDYPYEMNATFAPQYRYERIVEMLKAKDGLDVAYTVQMQNDTRSVLARRMIPLMRRLVRAPADPQAQDALHRVTTWDGDIRPELPEPAIYNTWLVRFMYQTFQDELGETLAADFVAERYIVLERFLQLLQDESAFFDDVTTAAKETASDIATRAFMETMRILTDFTGSADVRDWQWGRLHRIRFDHLLGKSKLLRPLINRGPYPVGGDCETNLRAHFKEIQPPYTAELAAGLRLIVAFDPEPRGHMVLITGQNEYFLSEHYDDMTDLWLQGKVFAMEAADARYKTVIEPQ